jgi:hypothetical protein
MTCRNTRTLREANHAFEVSSSAQNLHSIQTLSKTLASIDTDKLSSSIKLVQNLDLHLQHLLVSDEGLEKFQTLPSQIASAVESKLQTASSSALESSISDQIIGLQQQMQDLSTAPRLESPAASTTHALLAKISTQLEQLCENEATVSTGLNDLKQSIRSIQPASHTAPFNTQPSANAPVAQPPSSPPEPVEHGQKDISGSIPEFIDEPTWQSLLDFLETCSFNEESGHSVASFGVPYSYPGAKSCTNVPPMPEQLQPLLDKVNDL